MRKLWVFLSQANTVAGYVVEDLTFLEWPVVMLLYPLYASVIAIESTSKVDDEQWLAYWILYSFITLTKMVLQPILEWMPIWYTVKLVFVAWLVLPQFRGAAFIYDKVVRHHLKRFGLSDGSRPHKSPIGKWQWQVQVCRLHYPHKKISSTVIIISSSSSSMFTG